MNRTRLSEAAVRERAAGWARDLFESGEAVAAVLVRYDGRAINRAGRRYRPEVARADREVTEAARRGDVDAARAALAGLGPSDPGLALCKDVEALAAVLAERLRRGEFCFADGLLHERIATVTVWKE